MAIKRCEIGKAGIIKKPHMIGVNFHPFPKPKTRMDGCLIWMKLTSLYYDVYSAEKMDDEGYFPYVGSVFPLTDNFSPMARVSRMRNDNL